MPNKRYWTRLPNSLDTLIQPIGHVSPNRWTNVSKTVCYVSFRKNLLKSCQNISGMERTDTYLYLANRISTGYCSS
ncbi:hypothetical protein HMPREF1199_02234 [Hoylesella oralis CC98A]|nr:hypothetical protein HMPREF1199_02234 [Hoylesella oralis CC98A]